MLWLGLLGWAACVFFLFLLLILHIWLHIWFPRVRVRGGVGVYGEGPEVKVHAFGALGLDYGVFAGGEVFGGSEFEPAGADAVDGGFHGVLFWAGFSVGGAFDIADDALAAFCLQVDDVKAIKRNDGLLGLLRLL